MRDNDYPDYEPHRRQYEEMIARVTNYLSSYERDQEATIDELTGFLKSWLISHIAGTDQKYSGFLHEKGIR